MSLCQIRALCSKNVDEPHAEPVICIPTRLSGRKKTFWEGGAGKKGIEEEEKGLCFLLSDSLQEAGQCVNGL